MSSKRGSIPRTCKRCGEAFLARQDAVAKGKGLYCGLECSRKNKGVTQRVEKSCKRCGKLFIAKKSAVSIGKGIFCSQQCSSKKIRRPKVERACKQCNAQFLVRKIDVDKGIRVFCSHNCYLEFHGKAHARPMVQRDCKQCGKTFLVRPHVADSGKGIFCSPECWKESPKLHTPVVVCGCCGKVSEDSGRYKPKYCSQKCYRESRPKKIVEPWVRGHECDKWGLAVILRDKKCVRCGAIENLQAHHLKSWKHHPALRYDVDNGVALCPSCHHSQHPKLPLEGFVYAGGKKVKYCVVCETAFLVRKKTQRVCSRKCGWARKKIEAST